MPKVVDHATYARGTARARPGRPSPAQVEAFRAFLHAHATVRHEMERELERGGRVPLSSYDVLLTLAEGPPEGMRLAELADRVKLTRSGLTRLVDRLVEEGYIERRQCAEDRRGQYAVLTPRGRQAQRRSAPAALRAIARTFARPLAERELAALGEACERIARAAEE